MHGSSVATPEQTGTKQAAGSAALPLRSGAAGLHSPSLFQINTRATLQEMSQKLGRPATLDDFPDAELDRLATLGFEWGWFLGVWQTGAAGLRVLRQQREWIAEFQSTLPDFKIEDVSGSCFAITGYSVHADFGGNRCMERLKA